MPNGTLANPGDPMRMQETREGMSVEALGTETVDGEAARKYLFAPEADAG